MTGQRGEKNFFAKLTRKDVKEIRKLKKVGFSSYALGSTYGVSHTQVLRICRGEKWSHVK